MRTLTIDIETRSKVKLDKAGLYKYVQSPDFTILLLSYKFDKGDVKTIDLANGERIPDEFINALDDPNTIKRAHNAQFERTCLQKYFFTLTFPVQQWRCTMVKCAMVGLPMALEDAAAAIGTDTQKEMIGKSLIRFFCVPKKDGTYNQPKDFPEKWQQFKHYNKIDVVSEAEVDEKLEFFAIPEIEQTLWGLDQHINAYGIEVNPVLIANAVQLDLKMRTELKTEAIELTGLQNPNSRDQLKEWLELEIDERIPNLKKESVHALIKDCDDATVMRVLRIRQMLSKTSVSKYTAAAAMMGDDNRVKGTLQFYGALRTGRWAGRLLQVHNFPKNEMKNLGFARDLVIAGEFDLLQALWPDIPYVLSQLLRTMFVPGTGKKFVMADFAAIEARVIAWLAKERWRLDSFARGDDIYVLSAAKVFNRPVEQCVKGIGDWRAMGKVYELALGFQGSVGAVRRMDNKGILKNVTDDKILGDVRAWRQASPNIQQMWYDVQDAAISTVQTGEPHRVIGCTYFIRKNILFCLLPSGRCLSYIRPVLKQNDNGYPELWYFGVDQNTHQWKLIPTYGGKLVENIVQAIARDLLREKMFKLHDHKFDIPFHVHDEIIIEVPALRDPYIHDVVKFVSQVMAEPVSWAQGLPLAADAYASDYYYKKD